MQAKACVIALRHKGIARAEHRNEILICIQRKFLFLLALRCRTTCTALRPRCQMDKSLCASASPLGATDSCQIWHKDSANREKRQTIFAFSEVQPIFKTAKQD
jgi:hypothetical protein